MTRFLFRPRAGSEHTPPHHDPAPVAVNVTDAERQRPVIDTGANDALEPDLSGFHAVAHGIRKLTRSAPTRGMSPIDAAAIVRKRNAWMRDTTGTVDAPDIKQVNEALDVLCALVEVDG